MSEAEVLRSRSSDEDEAGRPVDGIFLGIVFFASGFAALLYQVVWQRSLYAIFGINIEAVTIVVTAFLLGLGIGSLTGGFLAERFQNLRLLFAAAEGGIAVYGVASQEIFKWAGSLTLHATGAVTGGVTFLLLLPPTLLMGLTLPLLVADGVRRRPNTGTAVSRLYFANTAGSAVAALAAVAFFLPLLGERSTIRVAAALNACVSGAVLLLVYLGRRR